jgi:hypothetical protein
VSRVSRGKERRRRPLWTCTNCSRKFANRNQTHSCGRYTLASHFDRKPAEIRAIFDRFRAALRESGPVKVLPEKTRIAFQVRMSFAQLTPRRAWVDGHLVLDRRVSSPVFTRVESFSPRNHLHAFRLTAADDVGDELRQWMGEAYKVGEQKHLQSRRPLRPSGQKAMR